MTPEAIRMDGAEPLDAAFAAALAEELVRLTGDLAELGYDLGSDPATLRRHMGSLQLIDRITQTQLGIADILRAGGPIVRRLEGVTLHDMKERLQIALDVI